MPVVMILAPLIGGALGLFNGLLITFLRLPSLVVTLGTMALYRGLAQVLAGDHSLGGFPDWFVGIDYRRAAGWVPLPLIIFLVMALVCGIVLAKTTLGRRLYAIGTNEPAARFAGIRVDALKLIVYGMSGCFAGGASLITLSRLTVGRYDMASGDELAVITAVVLGGTDISGGRGTIFGTAIALFLLGVIREGMGLANVPAENQLAVTGALLVGAVIIFRVLNTIRGKR
jgi:rhamnose transport system permease protein